MSALAPSNCFYTWAYVSSQAALGFEPWVLGAWKGESLVSGCTAFLKSGRINRRLEIASVPCVASDDVFWDGVIDFCSQKKVTVLEVGSFGSSCAHIPQLGDETGRRARSEFLLDLSRPLELGRLSSNHRRNIRRAEKEGLVVRAETSAEACRGHGRLVTASMDRRKQQGETVNGLSQEHVFLAFIQHGAAEIYQAALSDKVLSSVMVLRAPQGAYYQSAGTDQEGMARGASHFLVWSVAQELQRRGVGIFNLGGAQEGTGLGRFKLGFGSDKTDLETAQFFLGTKIRKMLGLLLRYA